MTSITNYFKQFKSNYKDNVLLAYPIVIAQVGHLAVQFADSVIVGQFVGPEALAAVSLVNSVFMLFMVIGLGLTAGLTPLIAYANGRNDSNKCGNLFKNSLFLNICVGIILFLLVNYVAPVILSRLHQSPVVLEYAKPYLKLMGWSIIPLMIFQTFKQFTEGLGYTKQAMNITIWGNVINILLGLALVKGFYIFPKLGITGVGIATLADRILMCLWMGVYIFKSKLFIPYLRNFKSQVIHSSTIKELIKIGGPIALQFAFEMSAFAGSTILAGQINYISQAAHQVALNLASITFMAAMGISSATTIKVGNYLGQKNKQQINNTSIASYHMVIAFMLCTTLMFILCRHLLPVMYTTDARVIHVAANLLFVAAVFQLFDGAQVVGLGILRGLGDVYIPTFILFLSYWVAGIPISWYLCFHAGLGIAGIWYGLCAGLLIAAVLLFWRYRKKMSYLSF